MGKLYEGLSETECVRMLAKLSRAHDIAEMGRLRNATPPEHAAAYNRALGLLRTLNGNLTDWLTIYRVSMERDRFRLQAFIRESAQHYLNYAQLFDVWKLIPYPATESEYRAAIKRERAELHPLDGYAEILSELDGDEPGLNPVLAEFLQNLPPELEPRRFADGEWEAWKASPEYEQESQEQDRRSEELARRIRALIDAAIERGELPKPKRKDGEPAIPWGVLHDWAEGSTPETYEPYGPHYHIPVLELFNGDFLKWEDVRPDSEAEAVRKRRAEIRDLFLTLSGIPRDERETFPSLELPKTAAALKKAREQAETLHHDEVKGLEGVAELALDAATVYASHRAQLEGITQALDIITREDFHGEDPLWPETRAQLEATHAEAERFTKQWASANDFTLRGSLRKAMGLEPYPDDDFTAPAPIPTEEPPVDDMLKLVREWGV
jgi:BMFP domain-containing protein YqiC